MNKKFKKIIALMCAVGVMMSLSTTAFAGGDDFPWDHPGRWWDNETQTWRLNEDQPAGNRRMKWDVTVYETYGNDKVETKNTQEQQLINERYTGEINHALCRQTLFTPESLMPFVTYEERGKKLILPQMDKEIVLAQGFSLQGTQGRGGDEDTIFIMASYIQPKLKSFNVYLKNETTGKVQKFQNIPVESQDQAFIFVVHKGGENDVVRGVKGDVFTVTMNTNGESDQLVASVNTAKFKNRPAYELADFDKTFFLDERDIYVGRETMENFTVINHYYDYYKDCPKDAWYYNGMKAAYENDLPIGLDAVAFRPDDKVPVVQVLATAARIHSIYHGTALSQDRGSEYWYEAYIKYIEQYRLAGDEINSWQLDAPATRMQAVKMLSRTMNINEIEAVLTDVNFTDTTDAAATRFRQAGVLTGDVFRPDDEITRAEFATIIDRMIHKENRATQ